MGIRNYLIEGVSGTGKTAVCRELRRRGYHAVNGDRALAYRGDPKTGAPVSQPADLTDTDHVAWVHGHHVWDVDKVRSLTADHRTAMTFLCGGSRNFPRFIDLFDAVFVLQVDLDTLTRRLSARPEDEFGGRSVERDLIMALHATEADVPKPAIRLDATAPLVAVVDQILSLCGDAGA